MGTEGRKENSYLFRINITPSRKCVLSYSSSSKNNIPQKLSHLKIDITQETTVISHISLLKKYNIPQNSFFVKPRVNFKKSLLPENALHRISFLPTIIYHKNSAEKKLPFPRTPSKPCIFFLKKNPPTAINGKGSGFPVPSFKLGAYGFCVIEISDLPSIVVNFCPALVPAKSKIAG